jgi:hypothetical protein
MYWGTQLGQAINQSEPVDDCIGQERGEQATGLSGLVCSVNGELGSKFLVEDLDQQLKVAPLTLIHSADSLSDFGTCAAVPANGDTLSCMST